MTYRRDEDGLIVLPYTYLIIQFSRLQCFAVGDEALFHLKDQFSYRMVRYLYEIGRYNNSLSMAEAGLEHCLCENSLEYVILLNVTTAAM